eukprot:UN31396
MEDMWTHVFEKLGILDTGSEPDGKLLLTDSHGEKGVHKGPREECMQMAFEKFNFNHFYVVIDEVLALYGSGRTTGCILDSGYDATHAVPIYEGYALPHAFIKQQTAGDAITKELQNLLNKKIKGHCPMK